MAGNETKTEETVVTVLEVTDAALAKVLEVRSEEGNPQSTGLRIRITGANGPEFSYDLSFEDVSEAQADDHIYQVDDLVVIIPKKNLDDLNGATLDLPSNPMQGGLVIRNPNRPNPLGDIGDLELTGDVPDRINQLLDQKVNPALASHGGFATLVGVDGSTAHVSMGGGCQGCSMSQATLTEGIRASILEAVPEIKDVVDVTDHSSGEQPFYS